MTTPAKPARYHQRRDFSMTQEPEGRAGPSRGEQSSYVVQIPDARSTHVDFRLDGRTPHGGCPLTLIRAVRDEGRQARPLVKHADERAAPAGTPAPRRARPARSGRTRGPVAAAASAGERR
ncbi:hypothetical protein [Streptomyces virginiae]|uniref:hypothetical protein n=1 Tax=Streptomyces virginiae TaxID=1961 RepID=UPI0036F85DAC